MLSRVASELYWLSRHLERAENIARILEVNQSLSMMAGPHDDHERIIEPLVMTDTLKQFQLNHPQQEQINHESVCRFLVWNREHPSSIAHCLEACRENAKAVRGSITSEMWACINDTWLQLAAFRNRQAIDTAFFDWVKERAQLFAGVSTTTLRRGQSYLFSQLGLYIERADNTARILAVKPLDEKINKPSPEIDTPANGALSSQLGGYYRLGALLRSVSAMETYNDIYRGLFTPAQVAELLIFEDSLPRSLRYCLNEVVDILHELPDNRAKEARKLAGLLHAKLTHGEMQDVRSVGLQGYLDHFIEDNIKLANAVHRAYLGVH